MTRQMALSGAREPAQVACLVCSVCSGVIARTIDVIADRRATLPGHVFSYELDIFEVPAADERVSAWCYSATNPADQRFDVVRLRAPVPIGADDEVASTVDNEVTSSSAAGAGPAGEGGPEEAGAGVAVAGAARGSGEAEEDEEEAPRGIHVAEGWSDEHSWFPPLLWAMASCRFCQSHLGWSFRPPAGDGAGARPAGGSGRDEEYFHGLIVTRLRPRLVAASQLNNEPEEVVALRAQIAPLGDADALRVLQTARSPAAHYLLNVAPDVAPRLREEARRLAAYDMALRERLASLVGGADDAGEDDSDDDNDDEQDNRGRTIVNGIQTDERELANAEPFFRLLMERMLAFDESAEEDAQGAAIIAAMERERSRQLSSERRSHGAPDGVADDAAAGDAAAAMQIEPAAPQEQPEDQPEHLEHEN